MKRTIAFIFAAALLLSHVFAGKAWRTSADGSVRAWTDAESFEWTGGSAGGLAHGEGTIRVFEGGRLASFFRAELSFGAAEEDFVPLGGGDEYAGEGGGDPFVPDGYGILRRPGGAVYAGEFRRGSLSGCGVRFGSDGESIYVGRFRDGRYEGRGELLEGGLPVYSGEFRDGVRHGEGVEFSGGSSLSGRWRNDVKEGEFEVETGGGEIVRRISFEGGVPDRSRVSVRYDSGVEWTGAVDGAFNPCGEGVLRYDSGDVYEGDVEANARNGFGVFTSADGRFRYSGEWADDVFEGEGEAVFGADGGSGWRYTGGFSRGAFSGRGTLDADGFSYTGGWRDGLREGSGTLVVAGARYDGALSSGRLNGRGVMAFPNGDWYDGEWVDSRQEGSGDYHWADGSSYSGGWEDGLQNGEGELFLADGSSYTGSFVDGRYDGDGIFCYANGDRYEGSFEANAKSGVGTYFFADGSTYEGEFRGDKIDGRGRLALADGSFFEGEFADGGIGRRGSLFVPDGDSFVVLTSARWGGGGLPDYGSLTFPNGDEYSGGLSGGRPVAGGSWRRRADRGAAERALDLYMEHEETISRVADTAQLVLAGVSLGGDIVGAAAMVPCPPVAGVAVAVARVADVANAVISALRFAAGTGAFIRDSDAARAAGDEERVSELRRSYVKEQVWNVADVALTFGSAAWKSLRSGRKAARAVEAYPALRKAVEETGRLADAARSSRLGGSFVRGTVELAYGRVGKALVAEYGDDAARLLFRHGQGAVDALTRGGQATLQIARRSPAALRALMACGGGAFDLLEKFPARADEIARVISRSGRRGVRTLKALGGRADAFLALAERHGDAFLSLAERTSARNMDPLVRLVTRDPSALKRLGKFAGSGGELNRAVRLASAGADSLKSLGKFGGKVPREASLKAARRAGVNLRRLENRLATIRSKGKIVLSEKELAWIRKSPKANLRATIRAKTGERTLGAGFQEFFVRLADGDKRQVAELLGIPEIRKTVNKAIRGAGGKHEWLMTKNYLDFLTNPKWGGDGAVISLALTELVQDTRSVAFRNGGTHFDKLGSGRFHDGLGKAIDASGSADELLTNVRGYAKKALTDASFAEFDEIFARCFGRL